MLFCKWCSRKTCQMMCLKQIEWISPILDITCSFRTAWLKRVSVMICVPLTGCVQLKLFWCNSSSPLPADFSTPHFVLSSNSRTHEKRSQSVSWQFRQPAYQPENGSPAKTKFWYFFSSEFDWLVWWPKSDLVAEMVNKLFNWYRVAEFKFPQYYCS